MQLTSIPLFQTNVTALETGTASHLTLVNRRFPIPILTSCITRDHFEDVGLDRKMIFKWILMK
jgi:hypothetical protein